jgi:photosystem II stability/assembly factor-like uncharacterized protein
MRLLLLLLLAAAASAQSRLRIQDSHTTESLRGVSVVSREIAWASGTDGTYLRTRDGGRRWIPAHVPNAANLDFRAVVAFSAEDAFLMSAGSGDQSRIYHTSDGGRHWQLQFTNNNPKGFFDSMAFWDAKHGIVLGDPIPDTAGKLKFELLETEDGEHWNPMPTAVLPEAVEGEGAFAASNSCIAILTESRQIVVAAPLGAGQSRINDGASAPDSNIWFATGGKFARVFHSPDRGHTWEVHDTPILHGPEAAGIFSIVFRNPYDGVIAGGDYKRPDADGPNLAFTHDGGKTWDLSPIHPQAYFSAVAYDGHPEAHQKIPQLIFAVAHDFVLDAQSAVSARRLIPKSKPAGAFNAISAFPEGGALIVGARGLILAIP